VLELLDGASKTEGVIVVGATNRPDKIDPAILRSGRLEKHIVIPAPDTAALVQLLPIISEVISKRSWKAVRSVGPLAGHQLAHGFA
jgi:SpoVK/Ycf46/Vps4 family AAA+-type ATPase